MGWINDSAPGHEGYLIGIVPALNPDDTLRYRELCLATDADRDNVILRHVQVGCDCGWRSPRLAAPSSTRWRPSAVEAPLRFEEHARLLWHEHIDLETKREPHADSGISRDDDPRDVRRKQ